MTEALFACTKCHSRHPFEELSQSDQFCKNCRISNPVVKCNYCRAEFQQSKGSADAVCRKCAHNVKLYGEPTACTYCNILATFTGEHCHRCTYNELKYGAPEACEQCKLVCAFNKTDDSRKKVDGKILCWLCTLAYKRILTKTRRDHSTRTRVPTNDASLNDSSTKQDNENSATGENKSHHRDRHHKHKNHKSRRHHSQHKSEENPGTPSKRLKVDNPAVSAEASPVTTTVTKPVTTATSAVRSTSSLTTTTTTSFSTDRSFVELASADHMIAITQLREQLEATKKIVESKDKMIMEKDKKMTEIKAHQYESEKILRTKITKQQTDFDSKYEILLGKNRDLQKQVKALSTKTKKPGGTSSPMVNS